jgi:hypothetical protein
VARRSAAFGFRFRFAEPPREVATFRHVGETLRGRGRGRVSVRVPGRGVHRLRLPFQLRLSA